MSVSITWRPHKPNRVKSLSSGTSVDADALREVFGEFPIILDQDCLNVLEGMAAVYRYEDNPYQEIIDLVEKYDVIELAIAY